MSNKKQENAPVEGIVDGTDFVELKRDMQSAKLIAWLQYNQQQLIAGAVVLVIALVGNGLWQEQKRSQKEAAALMYIKAMNATNEAEQTTMFDSVIKTYPDSGYAILAKLKKSASSSVEARKAALESLIETKGAPEFVWQARLDLAVVYIEEGDMTKAKELLAFRFGKDYEQARYAFLAKLASDESEKETFIQKALDAESHDKNLKSALEAELAQLKASK